MKAFATVDDVLAFAIGEEEAAYQFYTDLAGKVTDPAMRRILTGFAAEELGHKARLEGVRKGGKALNLTQNVQDLGLAEILVAPPVTDAVDYEQALILAMHKEKAAFRIYSILSETALDPGLQALFAGLAQEEAKHKLRFEVEYDERAMGEN